MTTEAGRRLHDWLGWHPVDGRDDYIAAIEAEASRVTLDAIEAAVRRWEAIADDLGERVFAGDPAATLATIDTLRRCAADLTAVIQKQREGGA